MNFIISRTSDSFEDACTSREFNTLEELMEFVRNCGHSVILHQTDTESDLASSDVYLEIYDDYREQGMCSVTWCNRKVKKGHHSNKLCYVHRQYKTFSKMATSRPWLMYKVQRAVQGKLFCESCGFDPKMQYPTRCISTLCGLLDVDHIQSSLKRTSQGEQPSNYQLLCKHCHILKSYDEGDFTRKKYKNDVA